MKKRTGNVVALERKQPDDAAMVRAAELMAEVMAKDNPSNEAREWFERQLGSSPDEWRHYGDLTAQATDYALEKFWLGYATKESVKVGAQLLKTELGFDEASPIERLLIEQAVLCHIRLGVVEHLYSRVLRGSYSISLGAHWEMRLTLCQRRYMKAITTLQKVRVMLARVPSSIQRPVQQQAAARRA